MWYSDAVIPRWTARGTRRGGALPNGTCSQKANCTRSVFSSTRPIMAAGARAGACPRQISGATDLSTRLCVSNFAGICCITPAGDHSAAGCPYCLYKSIAQLQRRTKCPSSTERAPEPVLVLPVICNARWVARIPSGHALNLNPPLARLAWLRFLAIEPTGHLHRNLSTCICTLAPFRLLSPLSSFLPPLPAAAASARSMTTAA